LIVFESGLRQRWKNDMQGFFQSFIETSVEFEPNFLRFDDLKHIFIITLIGLAAAFVTFVTEMLFKKHQNFDMRPCMRRFWRKVTLKNRREKKKREIEMQMKRKRLRTIIEEENLEIVNLDV
jgi:hypothetical protein